MVKNKFEIFFEHNVNVTLSAGPFKIHFDIENQRNSARNGLGMQKILIKHMSYIKLEETNKSYMYDIRVAAILTKKMFV